MSKQENPLKASIPLDDPIPHGDQEACEAPGALAFTLSIFVDPDKMTIGAGWTTENAAAEAVFFKHQPMIAAALLAITRGPVRSPGQGQLRALSQADPDDPGLPATEG